MPKDGKVNNPFVVVELTCTKEYSSHYYVLKATNNPLQAVDKDKAWSIMAGPFHQVEGAEKAMWFLLQNPDAPRFTQVPLIGTQPDVDLP